MLPLGVFPLLPWVLQNCHLSLGAAVWLHGSLGSLRLHADWRKRLTPQDGAEEAPRRGEVAGSRFGVTVLPLQHPPGGMLPVAGALPCSFGKVSGLAWCIPYIIHAVASLAVGLQPHPSHRHRAADSRGAREVGAAPPSCPGAGSHRPSAMPSGRPLAPEGATHGHVPLQSRAQVNSQTGKAARSGTSRCAGSRCLPAQGILSQGSAGARA